MNAPFQKKPSPFSPNFSSHSPHAFQPALLYSVHMKEEKIVNPLERRVVGHLHAVKAASIASGNKKNQAMAIAAIKLLDLLKDQSSLLKAMETWVILIGQDERSRKARPMDVKGALASLIHTISPWRALKQGHAAVKKYAQERADLAERFKSIIPKEASIWAAQQIAENRNLTAYVPEMARANSHIVAGQYLMEGKVVIQKHLASKLVELDDMESWTNEQTIAAIYELKEAHYCVLSELHYAIMFTYAMTASGYWAFFNQEEQLEHGGFKAERGGCEGTGEPGCTCEPCSKGISHKQSAKERFDWLEQMAGAAVCESKVWGEHETAVKALHQFDYSSRTALMWEMNGAGATIWNAGQGLTEEHRLKEVALSDARKDRKHADKELAQARSQIAELNRQVEAMRQARARRGVVEAVNVAPRDEELKQARKLIEQQKAELQKKEDSLVRTGKLLSSILSAQDNHTATTGVKLSPAAIREKRGIIIGGHTNLVSKLRKELPNCVFYSPDVKSLDEDAVRNGDYILFITGYVNHCLTGHAMRLARLNDIPCGYTDRTNVNLLLDDVEAIFNGDKKEVESECHH